MTPQTRTGFSIGPKLAKIRKPSSVMWLWVDKPGGTLVLEGIPGSQLVGTAPPPAAG